MSTSPSVLFCGMGLLGTNFVKKMRDDDVVVTVYNRTAARAEPLAEVGAEVRKDANTAAKGMARIHLTLKDDASVDAVMDALAPGFEPGVIVVDHTTVSADGARARAKAWANKDVQYVHAPVFMGPANARNASGIMLLSGAKSLYDALAPMLSPMTGKLVYSGDDPGRAAAMKLLGNQMILSLTMTLADSVATARAHGMDKSAVTELLGFFDVGASLHSRLGRLFSVDYDDPSWELQMARKDAGLMQAQAESAGLSLLLIDALAAAMDQRIAAGEGQRDWTVVAEQRLGRAEPADA